MTEKVYPAAMTLIDFVMSDDELKKLEGCLPSKENKIDSNCFKHINLTIGKYLAATFMYENASTPGSIKKKLLRLQKSLDGFMKQLSTPLPADNFAGFIFRSINRMPTSTLDGKPMANQFADENEVGAREDDCLRNLLDYQISKLHNQMDIYRVFTVIQLAHKAAGASLQAISSKGGPTGDPYVHEFFLEINRCYRAAGGNATYSAKALEFLDITRQIAVDHFEKCGLQNAAKRLKHVSREGLKDCLRDALEASHQKNG